MGRQLSGKKVAVLGLGRVGERVAGILSAMGCEVGFFDPIVPEMDFPYEFMPFKELLQWAEIVTLHCSGQCDCSTVLGREELAILSPGTIVINCSRGELLDEKALVELLQSGHLGGAGLDVYRDEPYSGPLLDMENVVLTPHASSYTMEGRAIMELDSVKNFLVALEELQ
ncbi:MAG: 2-hydroxyacid dehydrogenase [Desulfovibrio sp.]|uniref:2-hydroxyacid dehydrogenase n=1 Tax=Desulfovibrio sp. 7SRBS1 TaxID=3378064 RepID=UPI003B40D870